MSPVLVSAGGPRPVTLLSGAGGRQTLALLSTNQIRKALRGGCGDGHRPSCCSAGGKKEAGSRQPAAWRLVAGVQVSARSQPEEPSVGSIYR